MPRVPRVSGATLVKRLELLGYVTVRTVGSHVRLRHPQLIAIAEAERENATAEFQLKLRKAIDAVEGAIEDANENTNAAKDIP
jgi:hypothetical protein